MPDADVAHRAKNSTKENTLTTISYSLYKSQEEPALRTETTPDMMENSTSDSTEAAKASKDFIGTITTAPWVWVLVGILGLLLLIITLAIVYLVIRILRLRKVRAKQGLFDEIASKTKRNKLGEVDIILDYDYAQAKLGVEILQVRDLKIGRKNVEEKDLEVYCRLYLLPNTTKYQETMIKTKTFSPIFNEHFNLRCVIDDLDKREILIRVYRHFKFVRDAPIGDAVMSLSKTDLQLGFSSIPILSHNPDLDEPLGEISVTLRYNASTQKLAVTIIECRNLKAPDWAGSINPYCKLTLKVGDKQFRKDKSQQIKKTLNPYFNEVFSYKIAPNKLGLVDLLIQIKDKDIFGSGRELGAVRFGVEPDSEKAERQWEKMIENLRKPQTEWHHLMPSQKQ